MSRRTARNDRYTLSFGVDHTPMGCFFQLWEKAARGEDPEADDVDQPQVEADELFKLRVYNPKTLERNPALKRALDSVIFHGDRNSLRAEETIIDIGKACGLDVTKDVYELWD